MLFGPRMSMSKMSSEGEVGTVGEVGVVSNPSGEGEVGVDVDSGRYCWKNHLNFLY